MSDLPRRGAPVVIDDGALVAVDPADDPLILRRANLRSAAVALVLFAVALTLTIAVGQDPQHPVVQEIDDAWNTWMRDHRSPAVTSIALTFSFVGSAVVTWPLRIAALGVLAARRRHLQAAAFSTAIVVSELCIGPLKALIDRPRPPEGLVTSASGSFPSGHAIAAAVTAFGLVAAFLPRSRRRLHWTGGAASFAAAMAVSRTYLSVHWLSDTVAGFCIGVGCALAGESAFEEGRSRMAERR